MTIYFYFPHEQYGEFSNFSDHGFILDGKWWKTAEHYFQAQKFSDQNYIEKIRNCNNPKEASVLGQNRNIPIKTNWDQIKDDIMRKVVLKKFQTHTKLANLLVCTKEENIVENSPHDYYWGCGENHTGKNMLGTILMEVRQVLVSRQQP